MDQTLRFLQQENARLLDENRLLKDELLQLRDYLKTLFQLETAANQLGSEQDLPPLLDKILYYALTLLDSGDGSIALIDDEPEELVFTVVRGDIKTSLLDYRMPRTDGIMGWVATNGRAVIVNNVARDWRFSPVVDRLFGFNTQSMLCAPLKVGERVLGVIGVINKHSGEDFGDIDQTLLSLFGSIAAVAVSRFEEPAE